MAKVIVTITYDPETKELNVTGPIQDRILVYGMMEMAKDAIFDSQLKAPAQKVMTLPMAPGAAIDFDRRLREGGDKR